MLKHQTIAFLESNFANYFHLLIFLLRHFQIWCYEIEENRNYITNLTTVRSGLNENNIDQW